VRFSTFTLNILGFPLDNKNENTETRRHGGEKNKKIENPLLTQINTTLFLFYEAVQQFKIGRRRKANRALNPKRSKIFGVKSNCETASYKKKTCAKRKTKRMFLVKAFTEGKKVVGKAFLFKKKILVK